MTASLQGSKRESISKWIRNLSVCGNTVYGIGLQADPKHQDLLEFHPQIIKAYEQGVIKSEIISHKRALAGNTDLGIGNFPCNDNHIYFVASNSFIEDRNTNSSLDLGAVQERLRDHLNKPEQGEGRREFYTLEAWNIATGDRAVTLVTGPDGQDVKEPSESGAPHALGEWSLRDGYLYWVNGFTQINRTDITTGMTESYQLEMLDLDTATVSGRITYGADKIYIYTQGQAVGSEISKAYISTFDLKAHKELKRFEIKGLFEDIGELQTVSGFAVNPDPGVAELLNQ